MDFYPAASPITEMLVNMLRKIVIRVAYIAISLVVLALAVDWAVDALLDQVSGLAERTSSN